MNNIFELNSRVQGFDLIDAVDNAIKEAETDIIDANTSMLYSGVDAKGKSLGEYAPKTIDWKNTPGSHDHTTDRITLKDEGDFYAGKQLVKENKDYTVSSTDWKQDKLTADFGEEINGVDKDRMATITDEVLTPSVTKQLQAIL